MIYEAGTKLESYSVGALSSDNVTSGSLNFAVQRPYILFDSHPDNYLHKYFEEYTEKIKNIPS